MAYIDLTVEKSMYFGAKKELILQARELRKNMTRAEEILWSSLRRQQIDGVYLEGSIQLTFLLLISTVINII